LQFLKAQRCECGGIEEERGRGAEKRSRFFCYVVGEGIFGDEKNRRDMKEVLADYNG
jgi:hypothetical protein